MPQITTHYVAGPLDDKVFRAADQAGLPSLVISTFNGHEFEWRWTISPPEAGELWDVVLLLFAREAIEVAAAVYVVVTSPGWPSAKWKLLSRTTAASSAAIDDGWLAGSLRQALGEAAGPLPPPAV